MSNYSTCTLATTSKKSHRNTKRRQTTRKQRITYPCLESKLNEKQFVTLKVMNNFD